MKKIVLKIIFTIPSDDSAGEAQIYPRVYHLKVFKLCDIHMIFSLYPESWVSA